MCIHWLPAPVHLQTLLQSPRRNLPKGFNLVQPLMALHCKQDSNTQCVCVCLEQYFDSEVRLQARAPNATPERA